MAAVARYVTPDAVLARPEFSRRRWKTLASIILADLVALIGSQSACVLLYWHSFGHLSLRHYAVWFVPEILLLVMIFSALGLYPGYAVNPVEEFRRIVCGATITSLTLIVGIILVKDADNYSQLVVASAWLLSVICLVACRTTLRKTCAKREWWGEPVVIIGWGPATRRLLERLTRNATLGLRPVALLDDGPRLSAHSLEIRGLINGGLSLAPALARAVGCAIIATPDLSSDELRRVVSHHVYVFRHVLIVPDLSDISSLWVSAKDCGGLVGLEFQQPLARPLARFVKRALDVGLASCLLFLLMPLFALLYLCVRFTSPGPAFYGSPRVGQDEGTFAAWKFRSMVINADEVFEKYMANNPDLLVEWQRSHKLKKDPRITTIGRLLRKTSLDELPQLWNVVCGDMSLVGPRPIVAAEIAKYGEHIHLFRKVRPGITGLWQVSGRNNTTYNERVALDAYYVRNWSIWLDMYILGKTVKTVAFGEGAY